MSDGFSGLSLFTILLLALVSAPIWLGLGWEVWQGTVRPRLQSRARIRALADDAEDRHGGHAAAWVMGAAVTAARAGDSYRVGLLRRVYREIATRARR